MATIKHVKTPDGVTHDIGGGGGGSSTYTLTKSGSTITLTGSGGDVSSVVDSNTTYSISISGHTITLTPSSGSAQTVTVPDNNTTYTIGINGSTITLTPSSGSAQTITIPDATTSASGVMSSSDKTKLDGIASGAEVNVQSDWNQTDTTADDYIKNKPTIPPGVTVDSALSTTSTNPVENRVITNALNDKVDKEAGKGLSTNDFTTAEKNKLAGIQAGAEVNVQADWNEADSSSDAYIKNKPSIPTVNNGTLTIQKNGTTVDTFTANQSGNTTANITVPTATSELTNDSDYVSDASYVHTDNNFTNSDVSKLNGIESGAEVNVQADWSQTDATADDYIKNKPSLSAVATSGDYDDLTNKPTIPTVNDGTLTIQKNGTTIDTFTANQSGNTTVNVTVPTATSQLTNDSGYLTSESDPVYSASPASGITSSDISNWNDKQDELISGTNIKTINGTSILGSGNITTPDDDTTYSLSKSGGTVTLTGSDGSTSSVSVPTATSDLTNDSNFVSDANYVHTDNNFTNSDVTKLNGIESGAEVNVQADWNQTDSSADDYIKNKPIIPPGSTVDPALDPTSSNAVANSAIVAALDTKVDKVTGKGLSEEDFTSAEKTKLSGIASGAEVNVQADWNVTNTSSDAYIKNKPTLADWVISTGSSGNWKWRIWNSGLKEVEGKYDGTPATGKHYATVGGLYGYRVDSLSIPTAARFTNTDYKVVANWTIGSGFAMDAGTVSSRTTSGFNLYALASAANQSTVHIHFYCIGH